MSAFLDLVNDVREVMATTFGVDASDLPGDVTASNFPLWTSLAHVTLILALEEHFSVSFAMDEMPGMTSVDGIVTVLTGRLAH